MSILEFNRAAGVCYKRTIIGIVGPGSIAVLCLMAYMPFQQRFESFLSTRFDSFTADILAFLPKGIISISTVLWVVWLAGRIERRYGVPCPHCAKALAGNKAIVIASRNCPYCGKRVIDDEN